jgi:periplasmic protein TonB
VTPAARWRRGEPAAGPEWGGPLSLVLHGAALLLLGWVLAPTRPPEPQPPGGVEMVWAMEVDESAAEVAPPHGPPLVEAPPAPAPPPLLAMAPSPPAPPPPPPPPPLAMSPPPVATPAALAAPAPPLRVEPTPAPPPPTMANLPPPALAGAASAPPVPAEMPPPPTAPAPPLPAEAAPPPPEPAPRELAEASPPPPPQPAARAQPQARPQARPAPRRIAAEAASDAVTQAVAAAPAPAGPTTAPMPDATFRNAAPAYPEPARQRRQEGRVTLELSVDAQGRVTEAQVVQGSGYPILDAAARRAALGWRFRPALQEGSPVAAQLRSSVQFRLE